MKTTLSDTDARCHELAERARQASVTLNNIAPHTAGAGRCAQIRAWVEPAKACLRNVPALANRIIAERQREALALAAQEPQS